ncbi:hypothetical protein [Streptomyces mirabilis]|uniref:hypothetical protein n=1 Tax=Streptomyces mirabilis TaxID=68239 RepID=UPI0036926703
MFRKLRRRSVSHASSAARSGPTASDLGETEVTVADALDVARGERIRTELEGMGLDL